MDFKDKFRHWRRRMKFNRQYRRGKWNKLGSDHESVRYIEIDRLLHDYQPKSILDLGCGDGVLNRRMTYENFEDFLGVDYSSVSVEMAQKQKFPKATFETHDVLNFKPNRKFDVIIFNEVFYYIHDDEKNRVLDVILDSLSEKGVLMISIFREGTGCWEYFKDNPKLKELSFTKVTSHAGTTYWKVGSYSKT